MEVETVVKGIVVLSPYTSRYIIHGGREEGKRGRRSKIAFDDRYGEV